MTATRRIARPGPTGVGALTGLLLGAVILGPALAPGYTLHYDLVHVPDLALDAGTLGTDGGVPRAVPNDLLVALMSLALPGWVVQKVLLLGSLVVGAAGAGRLAATRWGALAGAVLWTWNPWVGERLGIGHWGYLMGYALLPWVLVAAARLRRGEVARWPLAATLALASLGGATGTVLAALLAALVLLVPVGPRLTAHRRAADLALVVGVAAATGAVWWWPFLTAGSRAADPEGVTAFAAAADTPFGVLGSLLLGGGLWNDMTWFDERTSLLASGLALLATVLVLGLALSRRSWWRDPLTVGASLAGAVGLLLAAAASLPGGAAVVTTLVTEVPGGGLLRDGQKLAALWVLLVVCALVTVVDRAAAARARGPWLLAAAAWPVATLPLLAWGHAGAWGSVEYPAAHLRVAEQVSGADRVAVLPWSTYRRYSWNEDRVVLDPWDRLVDGDVLTDDRLVLRDGEVAGEDPAASAVARAVDDGGDVRAALERAGVRWVVVQTDQPDPEGSVPTDLGDPVVVDGSLRVHDLGAPTASEPGPSATRALGLAVTAGTWLVLAGTGLARAWRGRGSRRGRGRREPDHGQPVAGL